MGSLRRDWLPARGRVMTREPAEPSVTDRGVFIFDTSAPGYSWSAD